MALNLRDSYTLGAEFNTQRLIGTLAAGQQGVYFFYNRLQIGVLDARFFVLALL